MPKILLVEDDLGLQQLTKDYLEHNGLEVDVLDRGDEVFPYLSENHVDLSHFRCDAARKRWL